MRKRIIPMNKGDLRKKLIAVRKTIPDKRLKSAKIKDFVLPLLYGFQVVGIYAAKEDEVDTFPIIEELLAMGKTVALPRTEGKSLSFYKITDPASLTVGKFGVKEIVKFNYSQNFTQNFAYFKEKIKKIEIKTQNKETK